MNHKLQAASIVLFVTILFVWWADNRRQKPVDLVPKLTGETEYCLTCHGDLPEISPSHPVEAFGCVLCHGGERLALDADLAHASMRGGKNPSDLAVVEHSCGGSDCHSGSSQAERDHIQRVMTSIQTTYTGAITHILYTYGEQPDLIPRFGALTVQDTSLPSKTGVRSLEAFPSQHNNPILQQFAQNCLTCHITAKPRAGVNFHRQTGCATCHTPTDQSPYNPSLDDKPKHTLSNAIPYTQCNTCHNRGNYDLRLMDFVERTDQPVNRMENYYQPIAQFTLCEYTLDCIDCHTAIEAMGDGDIHATQKDIQYVQCRTCHGTLEELPLTKTLQDPNDRAFRLALLNPVIQLILGDTILVTEKGEPLWNIRLLADGSYELFGKATGQRLPFHPVKGSGCEQNPSEQESRYCHACHAVER